MGWSYTTDELAAIVGADAPSAEAVCTGVSTDTRAIVPGDVFVALSGERHDGNAFVAEAFGQGAAAAICSVGAEGGPCLVVPDPLAALQRWAAHHRARHGVTVFAVTGSCGKTTTKDLVAALLATKRRVAATRGNLNNHIGCPLTLLRLDETAEFAVVEMGANHAGEIAGLCELARPTESAITLIAPAHLEGFGSIADVARAKGEIAEALPSDGVFYANTADPRCMAIADGLDCRVVPFGPGGDVRLNGFEWTGPGEARMDIAPVGEVRLPVPSRDHVSNLLLAIAVGLEHGVEQFEQPLREASLRTTRFRRVQVGPLTVVDDTYNANPRSVEAAIRSVGEWPVAGRRFAALGDMLEMGADSPLYHTDMGRIAGDAGFAGVFAMGDFADFVATGARAGGVALAEACGDAATLADRLAAETAPGDVVLVKGSRGLRMERVIEALRAILERGAAP